MAHEDVSWFAEACTRNATVFQLKDYVDFKSVDGFDLSGVAAATHKGLTAGKPAGGSDKS